jgi:hypothetical protein
MISALKRRERNSRIEFFRGHPLRERGLIPFALLMEERIQIGMGQLSLKAKDRVYMRGVKADLRLLANKIKQSIKDLEKN